MHLEAGGNQGSFGMASNSKFDIKSGLPLPLDDMRDVALGAAAPEPRCDVQDPSHAAIAAGDRWSRTVPSTSRTAEAPTQLIRAIVAREVRLDESINATRIKQFAFDDSVRREVLADERKRAGL